MKLVQILFGGKGRDGAASTGLPAAECCSIPTHGVCMSESVLKTGIPNSKSIHTLLAALQKD